MHMNTTATKGTKVKCSSVEVAYLTAAGSWRGFAHPYNITTEMESKMKVLEAIRGMRTAYEDMLEQHEYPQHLVVKGLSNPQDRLVMDRVFAPVLSGKEVDREDLYAKAILIG